MIEVPDGKRIVYPSRKYKNVYAMLDDPDLKPAFFKDYIFRLDADNTYKRDPTLDTNPYSWKCFSGSSTLLAVFSVMSSSLFI